MMSNMKSEFQNRIEKGLNNQYSRQVMSGVQDHLKVLRHSSFNELGHLEDWRKRARDIRNHTINYLDAYLEQFADNVVASGGKIYFANDKNEANHYIEELAKSRNVKTAVKSKSMVTEEIELNKKLEKLNIDVYETDLGEFIIQLAEDRPSHIIGPALHKSKEQVADIFSKLADRQLEADTKKLAYFAREYLRDKFFQADMGITGCNFGVAESGSIVLVSNEGNARLVTSLPKIHVVVMGMERLVPTWEELEVFLTLLPRSATGTKTVSYITAINGPKQLEDLDGPEELHVVVIDNGRSNLLGNKYQEALNCIRCGNCSNVCPVYRHMGGHAYGGVYNGPIGAVISPLMDGFEQWGELPFASSICGACTDACPVKIPLHEYLVELRSDYVEKHNSPWTEKMASRLFGLATSSPSVYRLGQKIVKGIASSQNDDFVSKGMGPLKLWTDYKDLPSSNKVSFRDWWQSEKEGDD